MIQLRILCLFELVWLFVLKLLFIDTSIWMVAYSVRIMFYSTHDSGSVLQSEIFQFMTQVLFPEISPIQLMAQAETFRCEWTHVSTVSWPRSSAKPPSFCLRELMKWCSQNHLKKSSLFWSAGWRGDASSGQCRMTALEGARLDCVW